MIIATMLKDDQENKIVIGSFLEAPRREAFEMDDIRQVESMVIDQLQIGSDENHDDTAAVDLEDKENDLFAD